MSRFSKIMAMAFAVAGFASAAQASVVTYTLDLNDSGAGGVPTLALNNYAVYVTVSTSDNYGLGSFSFSVKNVLTASNQSPKITYTDSNGNNSDMPSGFTYLRSSTITAGEVAATGSQDTIDNPSGYMVQGFGQVNGSIAAIPSDISSMYDGTSGPTQTSYKASLLLLKGTYSANTPAVWDALATVTGNLLGTALSGSYTSTIHTTAPTTINLVTHDLNVATPEPASLGVLALGGLALLARRRKVA